MLVIHGRGNDEQAVRCGAALVPDRLDRDVASNDGFRPSCDGTPSRATPRRTARVPGKHGAGLFAALVLPGAASFVVLGFGLYLTVQAVSGTTSL